MSFLVRNTKANVEPIEEGLHQAVCVALYDLGTHYNTKFDKHSRDVLIMWELPDIRKEGKDGKDYPRTTSKKFNMSMHEKSNLRKTIESWRGKALSDEELSSFDLTKLLGQNCLIQIVHTNVQGKTYANIQTIVSLPKSTPKKPPEGKLRYFTFEEGKNIPENTPDWITEQIKASDEWNADDIPAVDSYESEHDSDTPF